MQLADLFAEIVRDDQACPLSHSGNGGTSG